MLFYLFRNSSCGESSSSNDTAEDADRDAVAAENAKFVALFLIWPKLLECILLFALFWPKDELCTY